MKVHQVRAMLTALGEISLFHGNSDAAESLKKLSPLFQNFENQDIKKFVKLVATVRSRAGLQGDP